MTMNVKIVIYIQQDATLTHFIFLETALHVSSGMPTHHQERKQLYLQHLVFVAPLLLSAAIVEELELVRHPQHTQNSSNSSTIAAYSSNGVTNTRCCRYSCLRSWWWVGIPLETCRAVSKKINCVMLTLVGCILQYVYFLFLSIRQSYVLFIQPLST
jgi:hypothetical protein